MSLTSMATPLVSLTNYLNQTAKNWKESLKPRPGPYTDKPTKPSLGDKTGRDVLHRGGLWSDAALDDAQLSLRGPLQASIAAAAPANHTTTINSNSGPAWPWQGSLPVDMGSVNTQDGNRLSELNLFSWKQRGGLQVDFTLYHNSLSSDYDELGHNWTWTYDMYINQGVSTTTVHWGNGRCDTFTNPSGGGQSPRGTNLITPIGGFTPSGGLNEVLTQNADSTWTLTAQDQVQYHFNAAGFLDWIKDRNANQISITRNAGNYATRVSDATGRAYTLTLDVNNKILSVVDPANRTWSFARNVNDDLTTVTWPLLDGVSYTDQFAYNSGHMISNHTDRRGQVWTAAYNTNGSLAGFADPLNHSIGLYYATGSTTQTDALNHTITDNYSSGQLASRVDEAGYSQSYTYDANNDVLTRTDKRGHVWTATYDAGGNQLTIKDPLGLTTTNTYNATNDLLTRSDPLAHVVTYTYDGKGNVLTLVDALGRTKNCSYDALGQLSTVTDALSHTTTLAYSTSGDLTSIMDPLSHGPTMTFDTMGRLTSKTDALGNREQISYDVWGRINLYTHPDLSTTSKSYDPGDNVTSTTDELGHSTNCTYDSANRITGTTNPRGDSETYAYDASNRRISVTNGRGKTRTYAYTVRGEVYSLTMPDSTVETWSYNGNGDATAYTNALNQTITYSYDDADRQTGIGYPTGTPTTFAYDNASRRTSMVDSVGTTSWTYDSASRITGLTTPQGNMTFGFDNANRRTSMIEGAGTTSYVYDNANRMTSLSNPYSEQTTWTYDNDNRTTKKVYATGAYTSTSYDNRNRPSAVSQKNSSNATISAETYVYDYAGNLTSKTVDGTTTAYTFDNDEQLLTEGRTGYSASYTYDADGNRASKTVAGTTDSYSYDNGDRLISTSTKSYTYDAAGRTKTVVSGGNTTSLNYDYEGRVTSITYPGGGSNSFAYNGLDTRVGKVDSSGTFTYKRDGADVTAAVLSDGSAAYTPGISQRRSSASSFFHADRLGTTTQLTGSSQIVTDTKKYDAFGLLLSATGSTATPFGFVGQEGYQEDTDSGLKLLGHRYYDSSTGRFLTRDPAKDGRNWYVYCDSNPLKYVDPYGLQSMDSLNASLQRAIANGTQAIRDLLEVWDESGGAPQKLIDKLKAALDRLESKAGDWISKNLKGSINKEFPSQLRGKTLEEIRDMAQKGDDAAKKAWKLLNDSRFRKKIR